MWDEDNFKSSMGLKKAYLINLTQPFEVLLSVKAIHAVHSFLSGPEIIVINTISFT